MANEIDVTKVLGAGLTGPTPNALTSTKVVGAALLALQATSCPPNPCGLSYGDARDALARRLYDTTKVLFSDAELGVYLFEALRTFNALANYYRDEFTFNTANGVTWYDLTDLSAMPNTLRPFTVTDLSLIKTIEYHLLEPQTATYPLIWTGSKQFTITDLLNAIQQVQDQMLSDSSCTITQRTVTAPLQARTVLPNTVIDIRRVCWIPNTGLGQTVNCLLPSDIWAQQAFEVNFPTAAAAPPLSYRRSTTPPFGFDVDRIPPVAGNYDCLTIEAANPITGIATTVCDAASTILPIPDDWTFLIKYGVLAQLLGRESVASDPLRAQYCLARYKHGIAAIQKAPALLAARIANVPVAVEAVTAGDYYRANWQGITPGLPTDCYHAGLNKLAFAPIPDAQYSVLLSVIRNMVLPSVNADCLVVGRDDIEAILDYAQHVAMLKVGGKEFLETVPLYDNFIAHCRRYNAALNAQSLYRELVEGLSKSDERLHPILAAEES